MSNYATSVAEWAGHTVAVQMQGTAPIAALSRPCVVSRWTGRNRPGFTPSFCKPFCSGARKYYRHEGRVMRIADEERFREFARTHTVTLRRSAYLLCGDWHLAEDVVQAALIKLYRAWPQISGTDAPIKYARKTLLHCWLDEQRRPWRRRETRVGEVPDTPDDTVGPADAHQRAALRAELFRALDEITLRQRAVLVLRFFESLSIEETATTLGCSTGAVKSHTARGLAALRASVNRIPAGIFREAQ